MQLTRFSDYSLRALMMLATRPENDRWSSAVAIADAYGISRGHVAKALQQLATAGWVETRRGRDGGVRLAIEPRSLRIGDVLRVTEHGARLVECFDPDTDACRVTSACGLKHALRDAEAAFYASLDRVSLADLVRDRSGLVRLLIQP